MPFLDPEQARHLLGELPDAEAELDLRGLARPDALDRLRRLVEEKVAPGPRRYAVRIDPPVPGAGETLFQPVGRLLLEARRQGRIERFAPLSEPPGGGYFVDLGST
ncbi:MAG: hypothetical protein HY059_13475 [Proteobacteria bacterium]|nr:hypothetical protein [Pseudomonadota bacterium]